MPKEEHDGTRFTAGDNQERNASLDAIAPRPRAPGPRDPRPRGPHDPPAPGALLPDILVPGCRKKSTTAPDSGGRAHGARSTAGGLAPEHAAGTSTRGRPLAGGDPSCVHSAGQAVVTVPPAASILALADSDAASTVTASATASSPVPSTLTGSPPRTAPLATRSATVTSPPLG